MKSFFEFIGYARNLDEYLGGGFVKIIFALLKDAIREYSDDGELTKAEIAELLGTGLLAWAESQGEPTDD